MRKKKGAKNKVRQEDAPKWRLITTRNFVVAGVLLAIGLGVLGSLWFPTTKVNAESYKVVLALSIATGIIGIAYGLLWNWEIKAFLKSAAAYDTPEGYALQLAAEKRRTQDAQNALSAAERELTRLRAQAVQVKAVPPATDEEALKVLRGELSTSRSRVEELAQESRAARRDAEEVRAQLDHLRDEKKVTKKGERSARLQRIEELEDALEKAMDRAGTSELALEEARSSLDVAQKNLTARSAELQAVGTRSVDLENQLRSQSTALAAEAERARNASLRVEELKRELEEVRKLSAQGLATQGQRFAFVRSSLTTQLESAQRVATQAAESLRGLEQSLTPAQHLYAKLSGLAPVAVAEMLLAANRITAVQALAGNMPESFKLMVHVITQIPAEMLEDGKLHALMAEALGVSRRFELFGGLDEEIQQHLIGHFDQDAIVEALGCYLTNPGRFDAWSQPAIVDGIKGMLPGESLVALFALCPELVLECLPVGDVNQLERALGDLPEQAPLHLGLLLLADPQRYSSSIGDPRLLGGLVEFLPAWLRAKLGSAFAADFERQSILLTGGKTFAEALRILGRLIEKGQKGDALSAAYNFVYEIRWLLAEGETIAAKMAASSSELKLNQVVHRVFMAARTKLSEIVYHSHPLVWRAFLQEAARRSAKLAPDKVDPLDALIFWDVSPAGFRAAGDNDYSLGHVMGITDIIDSRLNLNGKRPKRTDRIGHVLFRLVDHRGGKQSTKPWLLPITTERADSFNGVLWHVAG